MNREQKRNYIKKLKAKGYSKADIDKFMMIKEMYDTKKFLQEGQKVKLNLKNMKEHPDYPKLTEKYRSWVESHAEDIFTVEYDEKHKDDPTTVCLKEDDLKWLFWEGDLTVIDESEEMNA